MIRPRRTLLTSLGLVALLFFAAESTAKTQQVVVSIRPLHALVAGVMEGVGSPDLLIKGNGTPHSYQMRPSDARALSRADVIFWIGETMESFLTNPLATLGKNAVIVSALTIEGMRLLPARAGGLRQPADVNHEDAKSRHDANAIDPHIWLSPTNAILIVRRASEILGALDPNHATTYRRNAASVATRIEAMDAAIAQRLAPVAKRPFLVLHDAFQYFEDHYALRSLGAISIDPDRPPGARRLRKIREIVAQADAICVFREPQFSSPLVDTVVEGTQASVATLDPLGAGIEPSADAYFRMMDANADALLECLSR